MHRIKNRSIKRRCGNKDLHLGKVNLGALRWFGHIERMDEAKLTKRIYRADVDGVR